MNGNRYSNSDSDTYVEGSSALTHASELEYSPGAAQAFFIAGTLYTAISRCITHKEQRESTLAQANRRTRDAAYKFQDISDGKAERSCLNGEYDRLAKDINATPFESVKDIAITCYSLSRGHLLSKTVYQGRR